MSVVGPEILITNGCAAGVVDSADAAAGMVEISRTRVSGARYITTRTGVEGLGVQVKKVVTRALVRRLEVENRKSKIENR